MKIGIVTITDYYNFGNRLQNYALQYVLEEDFGCDTITLEAYSERHPRKGRLVPWIKEEIARLVAQIPVIRCMLPAYTIRWARFQSWSKANIKRKRYYDCDSLSTSLNRQFDYFFAGSDQIWNCNLANYRKEDFFLEFADEKKRFAISASFGVDNIPEEYKGIYREGMAGFSHISVREEAGARIVKEILDKDVPVLIDPVMMLTEEDWEKIERKPKSCDKRPYVFVYLLGGKYDKGIFDWAERQGYGVCDVMGVTTSRLRSDGPAEFLYLIRNATFVYTDSFHAAAFAIIFHKPFAVCRREIAGNNISSRLETLLQRFGFQNRWAHKLSEEDYLRCNFKGCSEILDREKDKFEEYVRCVLNYERGKK